ncbi:MAG TPA: DUF493 domain-containing protein [Flavobacteriales bacterium]|jgi:putative lipoic acid-binding regulatory protein|nr:DUF493 domain-containing protein [Flavobacteriales bacterium]
MTEKHEFYVRLKEQIEKNHDFPIVYLFKFIIPNDNRVLALTEALFGAEAEVQIRQSSKGNYISISGKELMIDADSIINRYKSAEKIKGLIAL